MPDRIQRNRTTGEYRILTETGWQPYTPPEAAEQPEMYHPGQADTPTTAALNELLRTGKEAGIGLARSPLDAIKGLFNLVTSPVDTIKGMGSAIAHPLETIETLGDNPREAGSALGQLLLGKVGLPRVPGAAGKVPGAVSAIGRGMESAGVAAGELTGGRGLLGAGAAMGGSPMAGAAIAAAPYALKAGGKGLQAVGGGLERLKAALRTPDGPKAPQSLVGAGRMSREVPYQAEASAPPRRGALLEQLQSDVTPAWWERVKAARATPEAAAPSAGPHPEMAARVVRAAEANPRRTSLLDELQREEMSNPDIIRRRVTRAAGEAPAPYGGYPAPSDNSLMEMLPPPETDAWSALSKLRSRSEAMPADVDIDMSGLAPLDRLSQDAIRRARQAERYGRAYRPE